MKMAKAYDTYVHSISCGYGRAYALEYSCVCWGVKEDALLAYIAIHE